MPRKKKSTPADIDAMTSLQQIRDVSVFR